MLSPCDVRLRTHRIVPPDLFAVHGALSSAERTPLDVVPVLCVEILSPSTEEYDRRTKRLAYAEAGVREYWVVAPERGIEVFSGDGLVTRAFVTDEVASGVLPGLRVDVRPLLGA